MGDPQVSTVWRDEVMSPWTWRRAANQAGGVDGTPARAEGGGYFVTCDAVPRRAYLKPTRRERGRFTCRAAREKIVADLAHDLGVRVPPVLLFDRRDAPPGEETLCAVSLVMFPRQYSWRTIKDFVVEPSRAPDVHAIVMADLPTAAARALALDAWVMQWDHGDHPHNIVFGLTDAGAGHLVFLDYAMALGHAWVDDPRVREDFRALGWVRWDTERGWAAAVETPFPPDMARHLHPAVLAATIEKIEEFPEAVVRSVVERIPDRYLDDLERTTIIDGLLQRRALIRGPLERQLGRSIERGGT